MDLHVNMHLKPTTNAKNRVMFNDYELDNDHVLLL